MTSYWSLRYSGCELPLTGLRATDHSPLRLTFQPDLNILDCPLSNYVYEDVIGHSVKGLAEIKIQYLFSPHAPVWSFNHGRQSGGQCDFLIIDPCWVLLSCPSHSQKWIVGLFLPAPSAHQGEKELPVLAWFSLQDSPCLIWRCEWYLFSFRIPNIGHKKL